MSLSGQHLSIDEIVDYYTDCECALRAYFAAPHADPARFAALTQAEIDAELRARLEELGHTQSLVILAAIEAMFRVDFELRCRTRKRDALSREFRSIRKAKGRRINFDEDILQAWKDHGLLAASLVTHIRDAMRLRHWLAHGRHWIAKLGRRYGFTDLVALADELTKRNILLG